MISKRTVFICKLCWNKHHIINVLYEGEHPAYGHEGHVYCPECDQYDTDYNPGVELGKIEQTRRNLDKHEAHHLTANAALYEWEVEHGKR